MTESDRKVEESQEGRNLWENLSEESQSKDSPQEHGKVGESHRSTLRMTSRNRGIITFDVRIMGILTFDVRIRGNPVKYP